ncbi:DUF2917 domain-containing protein [Bordetella bronchiseptica]|uniref:DUF2917 domain-containing protein n=1 Tax=Bordetella bronchiseptica TaxID=518 RepID=UPI00028F5B96|nr:DUF2917 domain-containing protein [Bordetella bronchiseptica]BAO71133.1 hypothetical protein BBS798_4408 [Bordetella bronchiseptica]CCN19317.1 hypothetical protein BN114_3305 [Bordetella bronchiseptica MO211]
MVCPSIELSCTEGMSFALGAGSTMLLRRAAGLRIACLAGTVWLSEYRCAQDSILAPGASVVVQSDHDVVLSGLPYGQVALIPSTEPDR